MYRRSTWGPRNIARLLLGPRLYFVAGKDPQPEMPPVPDPRRGALAGLIIAVLLVVGGVLLIHALGRTAKLQDCVMSGRTNCAPITSPPQNGG